MAQRPLTVTVDVLGPFEVLKRPLTLRPKDTKPPAPGDPARGPVAWWKFDETDGAEAADASGHRLAGRVQSAARWMPGQGRVGGALDLDGAKNFVDCGDRADFDFRDGVTVSFWLKPRSFKKSSQTVAAKGGDTWRFHSQGDKGQMVFSLTGPQTTGKDKNKAPRITSKRSVDDGQWHHVVGVYDGQRVALYVDGALEGSVTAAGALALNTEPLWLGNTSASRNGYFNGLLDDVRLYGCGLTEDEITALWRSGAKGERAAK
ncbi:MAG: LamG domain-containing protein [Verrucomicrobia bacterium]|nr:LamG domain-containing protein [Verrucomicrobiota bacterium]